jgi:hypothetical protein
MKDNYRGFLCAGILGCVLVLLTTPLLAQKAANNNNPCNSVTHYQECGILKGCKVAGPGVAVGTPFTFTHSSSYGSGTATLPAGPAPGGNCKIGDPLPTNTPVTIQENIPGGVYVSNIAVQPASQLVSMNLSTGTVIVKIGNNNVTEVTYTNQSLKSPTGYLEICKQSVAGAAPLTGNFTFTIPSGIPASVSVEAGYCSPPIEVPTATGTVTITETSVSGIQLVSCSVYPSTYGPCTLLPPWSVKVPVHTGPISTQTVVTITNGPVNGTQQTTGSKGSKHR